MILAILLLAAAAFTLSSCVVVARPRPAVGVTVYGPPVEYGYQPLLYNGYVVYYDNSGIPFYWYGGTRVFVPVIHRDRYVTHYRTHHRSYHRWHKHRGRQYRGRHYKGRRGGKPTIKPKSRHGKPTISPKRGGKPTISPKKGKPTVKPKKKKKDKPTIRPK
jgi:hypothetical protein